MSIVSLAKLNLRFNNRIAEIIQNILFSFTLLLQTMFYCVFLQSHGCNMGGKCGNRTEDKAAESHEGADAGRAGRPRGVIEGLYITGREGSDLHRLRH